MSSSKRYLLIVVSFAIGVTTFAIFAPRAVHAVTTALVQVVNTPANPVPVAPTTARQAVYLGCYLFMPSGALTIRCDLEDAHSPGSPYEVPAGKRLVVDTFTGRCTLPSGERSVLTRLHPNCCSSPVDTVYLDPIFTGNASDFGDIYVFAQNGPIYAEPYKQLSFYSTRNASTGAESCDVEAFGHLEDIL
jgi:hypothetical protein